MRGGRSVGEERGRRKIKGVKLTYSFRLSRVSSLPLLIDKRIAGKGKGRRKIHKAIILLSYDGALGQDTS